MEHLSTTAVNAYHDLVRALRDDEVADIRGAPFKREKSGKVYWYDSFRIGNENFQRYIGPDNEEIQKRIARYQELKELQKKRDTEKTRYVRILRDVEGLLPVEAGLGGLLHSLAKAGAFRLGATIVGTNAFRLYEGGLGVRIPALEHAATDDIDIASFERLSLNIEDTASPALEKIFSEFKFEPVQTLDRGQAWRWRQSNSNTIVEFLTASFEEGEGIKNLPALGVSAQSLHHMNYLIADPIPAAVLYRSGVLVQVPRPERFAVHKLIVADRRKNGVSQVKSMKDRSQAKFLVEALAELRPGDLRDAFEVAMEKGPKWQQRIESSLSMRGMEKTRELLESL